MSPVNVGPPWAEAGGAQSTAPSSSPPIAANRGSGYGVCSTPLSILLMVRLSTLHPL